MTGWFQGRTLWWKGLVEQSCSLDDDGDTERGVVPGGKGLGTEYGLRSQPSVTWPDTLYPSLGGSRVSQAGS